MFFFFFTEPEALDITSAQSMISLLPAAFLLEVSSVPILSISSATPSVATPRASSPPGTGLSAPSAVATMGSTFAVAASPSRGSFLFIFKRLNQRDAMFARLGGKYVQREKFVTLLEVCIADMQSQRITSCSVCDALRAANDNQLKTQDINKHDLSTFLVRVFKLEAKLKAPRTPPSGRADAVRDRAR